MSSASRIYIRMCKINPFFLHPSATALRSSLCVRSVALRAAHKESDPRDRNAAVAAAARSSGPLRTEGHLHLQHRRVVRKKGLTGRLTD